MTDQLSVFTLHARRRHHTNGIGRASNAAASIPTPTSARLFGAKLTPSPPPAPPSLMTHIGAGHCLSPPSARSIAVNTTACQPLLSYIGVATIYAPHGLARTRHRPVVATEDAFSHAERKHRQLPTGGELTPQPSAAPPPRNRFRPARSARDRHASMGGSRAGNRPATPPPPSAPSPDSRTHTTPSAPTP